MSELPSLEEIKQQCIFCQIINGQVPSKKVYEDDKLLVVLDINPASPGHLLVLTKEHYAIMPQIPEEVIEHLGLLSKALSHVLLSTLKCEGTSVFVANGPAAGQRAQHFMMHVIPRNQGDDVGLVLPEKNLSEEMTEKLKQALAQALKKNLGTELNIEPVKKTADIDLDSVSEVLTGKKKVSEDKGDKQVDENINDESSDEEPVDENTDNESNDKESTDGESNDEENEEDDTVSFDDIANLLK